MTALLKHSALSGVYRMNGAKTTTVAGWEIAESFGDTSREQRQLAEGAVLVDWSHIGKLILSRGDAAAVAEQAVPGAAKAAVLGTTGTPDQVALRLTPNDYQLLCQSGQEQALLEKMDQAKSTVTDSTGALACFALGGPRRDEVLERSTAVDLRRDKVVPGSVIQLTIHTIHCTLYRTENLEIITHSRTLSESLYDGLMDVGVGVGLMPAGLGTIPVSFEEEK